MAEITEQRVLDALRGVRDPDRGGDVVALGMVSGLNLTAGRVSFSLAIDPKDAVRLEPLRRAAEAAVAALPGVVSAAAILTAHRAQPAQQRTPPHAHPHGEKPGLAGVRAIVAVASGKGGVGKSTVAANLALGLAAQGLKVGLLDCDVYGPSMPLMMGVKDKPTKSADGKRLAPPVSYGVKVMSMGFLTSDKTPMIWRGPMVANAVEQMLRGVEWEPLDVLVVDMPPGTGDAQLTLAQRVPLAGAVIVSTPQDIALLDARKGLNMFRQLEVPVLGIVENMSYFHCPHCGERTDVFGHGGAKREAEDTKVEFLGEIPLDVAIRDTSDSGKPITATRPDSKHAEAFREIARKVWAKVSGESTGVRTPPRIVFQ
ncbi:MAG: Mrp/NBP35 family ATP-binding protein [Alphaproteobacteria bacterium]